MAFAAVDALGGTAHIDVGAAHFEDGAGVGLVNRPTSLPSSCTSSEEGVSARVIDCYSVKPIDVAALRAAADATGLIVTIEDHYPAGGLGEAVLQALADRPVPVTMLAVDRTPMSGTGDELRDFAGISAAAIVRTVQGLVTGEHAGAAVGGRHASETGGDRT